ncbi:MAG: DUF3035 domain-containing protein [Rhodobacteraceae bacterium]|nr:DUF3035 domain-containing protein [Paracoccaceae bacterium]
MNDANQRESGRMTMPRLAIIVAVLMLAACSRQGLVDLRSNTGGPDEFLVQPAKPLTQPDSYSVLPPPTPGGANVTDPSPLADAVSALGGRPGALVAGGAATSDSALVSQASRFGVQSGIRTVLAEEDESFRKRRGRLTQIRLFRRDTYREVYRRQAIDPFAEARRYRRAGVTTPSSPPEYGE